MLCVFSLESTISSRSTLRADNHLKYFSLSCVMLSAPLLIVSLTGSLDCCSLEMSCSRLEDISQVHRVPCACSQPDHCWRGILHSTLDDSLFASVLISQARSCSSCAGSSFPQRSKYHVVSDTNARFVFLACLRHTSAFTPSGEFLTVSRKCTLNIFTSK